MAWIPPSSRSRFSQHSTAARFWSTTRATAPSNNGRLLIFSMILLDATLTNGDQLSVYLLMDCLNGFFQDVYSTSLAETLLLAPNGGAVAVWASSGFTNQPPQASMNQALLQILKTNPSMPIASAIVQAKTGVTDNDVRRTWIFFGDPAMLLQLTGSSSTGHHPPVRVNPPVVLHP